MAVRIKIFFQFFLKVHHGIDPDISDCVTMAVAASACAYAAQTKVCGYNILGHQCKIFNCDTV
jgi:hypothetical protein